MRKTVREAALELEVADLRRELLRANNEVGRFPSYREFCASPDKVLKISPITPVDLRLAAKWQCDVDAYGRMCIEGEAISGRGKFIHTYWVGPDEKNVWGLTEQHALQALGKLHERVVETLGKEYIKFGIPSA